MPTPEFPLMASVERVLMTGDTVGGVWTFTLELAEALGAHGVEVLLAAMGGQPSADQWQDASRIPNLRLFAGDYKLEWMNDPWDDVAASAGWLLDLENRFAPDVIHLNSYGHGSVPWRAPAVLTAHSCVLSWYRAVYGESAPAKWDRYRAAVSESLKAARLVAAPSQFMLRALEENYKDVPHGVVVHNGRKAALFNPLPKEPFILSVGRLWDDAKNTAVLASVAHSLLWPVYLAGDPRHPDGGTADLGACRALGPLSAANLAEWYGHASIYALPARYEPFGLSVLEAALSGCALVLGDIPSLREIWQDSAVFVPPNDADAWARELRWLIADSAARHSLGLRAHRQAIEFTPQRMAREYLACYQAAREPEKACA
jgi:glycogen synthase